MIAAMPTVLIADDDPVSLRFLQTALEALGCEVVAAASGVIAIEAVQAHAVDLLMLDLNMPDIGGAALLHALRERAAQAPAVATSAELGAAAVAALRAAGFADTLLKPASLEHIEKVLLRHVDSTRDSRPVQPLAAVPQTGPPILDDASALAAIGGDRAAMSALRGLFGQELDALESDLRRAGAQPEPAALGERLHRLRASSGFCGAAALGAAALRLQQALRGDPGGLSAAIAEFTQTCHATQRALAAQS
jgi:CheY-like chemotaxis protein